MKFNITVGGILVFIFVIGVLVGSFFMYRLINKHSNEVANLKETIDKIGENQIHFRNKIANSEELKTLIKLLRKNDDEQSRLLQEVIKENKRKSAEINDVCVIVSSLERTVKSLGESSSVSKKPAKTDDEEENKRRDSLSYEMKKIYGKDAKGNDLLLAWAMYFPNQPTDKRWRTGTYPLDFHVTVVESENIDGLHDKSVEIHVENNNQKETAGKEFPIHIKDIVWEKRDLSSKKFMWWNPRFSAGGLFAKDVLAPKIDVSISSYGTTKIDMDWRFLSVGVGVTEAYEDNWSPVVSFEPFSWNVGNLLPGVHNLFIAPAAVYNIENNDLTYGIGVSIPF